MRRVAVPGVRPRQRGHQLDRRSLAQARRTCIAEPRRRNPVDPALIAPTLQVEMLDHVERDMNCLDDRTAHVEDVERTIRRVHEVHGPEPVVRRADELRGLLARAADRLEGWPIRNKNPPMDQVILGVADEHVSVELRRVGAAAIDGRACAGVDDVVAHSRRSRGPLAIGDPSTRTDLPPALDRADPEDRHRAPGDVPDRRRHGEVRVPRQLPAR